jgi:hypothetical protein
MRRQLSAIIGLLLLFGSAELPAWADWKVGLAKTAITPSQSLWLSGYSSRQSPAEGKIHDLGAKAVAFQSDDGARLVVLTLDLGSVNPDTAADVAQRVNQRFGLPRGSLVLNCSHTHCAPEIAIERRVFHQLADAEELKLVRYIGELNDKLVDLVGAALADLQPAKITVGRSTAAFAFNRRHPSGIDPMGVTDHDVPVMRITDLQDTLRGIVFGYACHNTTLDFQFYCGDYAGFAQAFLEENHPGAQAMFVMGCGGDQNPQPRHGPQGLEYARQHGRTLAKAVDAALAGTQQPVGGPLHVAYEVIALDLEPLPAVERLRDQADAAQPSLAQRKARYLLSIIDAGKEVPTTQACPLHVAAFGTDLLMVFISGETVVDYALRCKTDFAGPFVWVAGYCDDVFAYLPSRRVLFEGGYEGRTGIAHQLVATPFLPTVEDRVMGALTKLVSQVRASSN